MENVDDFRAATDGAKVAEMRTGANWFFIVAILAIVNSLIVAFGSNAAWIFGLGSSHYAESTMSASKWAVLGVSIACALVIAAFGYFARKGSDIAFILGMFVYFADALLILSYRDIWAFAFHMFALFFIFKGLLGSRKRMDPSV